MQIEDSKALASFGLNKWGRAVGPGQTGGNRPLAAEPLGRRHRTPPGLGPSHRRPGGWVRAQHTQMRRGFWVGHSVLFTELILSFKLLSSLQTEVSV